MMDRRYVDLLGRDYREFTKACRSHGVYERLTPAEILPFCRGVLEYMRDKPAVDLWFAVEQMSRK